MPSRLIRLRRKSGMDLASSEVDVWKRCRWGFDHGVVLPHGTGAARSALSRVPGSGTTLFAPISHRGKRRPGTPRRVSLRDAVVGFRGPKLSSVQPAIADAA
jgi:hypothetical protein